MDKTLSESPPFGALLREWRQRRRLSQFDLALDAEVSARHISFMETGRSRPSREMIEHLSEMLDVPLRARNALLIAAGFAPAYPDRPLDHPALAGALAMVERVLKGHEPFPAIAVDRCWNLVAANSAVGMMLDGCDPALLEPPINVLRLSLHPRGLAPRIANLPDWREHLLARLAREADMSADGELKALLEEISGYGAPSSDRAPADEISSLAIPFQLSVPGGVLSFITTTMVFGTPRDIALSELAVEAFFPADDFTLAALRGG